MRKKRISVNDIISYLGDDIIAIYGNYKNVYIDNLSDADSVNATSLDWINPSKKDKKKQFEESKARVFIIDDEIRLLFDRLTILVKFQNLINMLIVHHILLLFFFVQAGCINE